MELIKKSIQRASKYTITNEQEFRKQILAELSVRQEVDDTENEEKIAHAEARIKELDTLIGRLYETYAMEKISEKQYERLMHQYEDEYGELETLVEELTPTMIHEFIDKIVIHESNGVRGFGRKQKIEIYFNFIGQFIPPYSKAELKAEAKKQAVKKAEKDRNR